MNLPNAEKHEQLRMDAYEEALNNRPTLSENLSNCCGARMYDDSDICSDCKEHCGVEGEEDF